MAHIVTSMQALGFPNEVCPYCEKQFVRGQTMFALEEEDGNPLGWFCQVCIDEWKAHCDQKWKAHCDQKWRIPR